MRTYAGVSLSCAPQMSAKAASETHVSDVGWLCDAASSGDLPTVAFFAEECNLARAYLAQDCKQCDDPVLVRNSVRLK